MNIEFRGNQYTNKSSRSGYKPIAIVDHITAGTAYSCDNWFRSSGNTKSSAHFLVTKKGEIKQYVRIEDKAWANGLTSGAKGCTSELVKEMKYINPNNYTVSIEHESFGEDLTQEQYKATVWLHKYIIDYVKKVYGYNMPIDRKHILGHREIDIIKKPSCPMPSYPFSKIIEDLKNDKGDDIMVKNEGIKLELTKPLNVDLFTKNDRTYVPIKQLVEILGHKVGWNGKVLIDDKEVTFNYEIKDGVSYAWIRDVVNFIGMDLNWLEATNTIQVK